MAPSAMNEANGDQTKPPKTHYERNAEYWAALEKWMDNVRSMTMTCNMLSGLPFPLMMGAPLPFNLPPAPPMMFAFNNYPHPIPNFNHVNGTIPPQTDCKLNITTQMSR